MNECPPARIQPLPLKPIKPLRTSLKKLEKTLADIAAFIKTCNPSITFTIFSDKLKGEIAKGGSYNILTGETATGCTIYTEKVYPNLMLNLDKDLVYIPYLNMKDADEIIKKGHRIVFGSASNSEFEKEASEMNCKYIWKDNTILKLKS